MIHSERPMIEGLGELCRMASIVKLFRPSPQEALLRAVGTGLASAAAARPKFANAGRSTFK